MKTQKMHIILIMIMTLVCTTNCKTVQNTNNKQRGAVIGAAGGAVLGAILGNNIGKGGNGELGAVIGGVIGGGAGVLIGNKMDKNAQRIEEEIPGAKVERIDDDIVVTFDENSGVNFDTNKYTINDNSKVLLDKMANLLMEFPDTKVLVVGHTDSAGADAYNLNLSRQRAESVTNYFVAINGLQTGRFVTNWFGETSPVASNDTPAGRAQNRRVNIVLIPNEKMKGEATRKANGG